MIAIMDLYTSLPVDMRTYAIPGMLGGVLSYLHRLEKERFKADNQFRTFLVYTLCSGLLTAILVPFIGIMISEKLHWFFSGIIGMTWKSSVEVVNEYSRRIVAKGLSQVLGNSGGE